MAATETHAKVVASARWLKKALWFALGRATLQKKGLKRWRFGSCPFCRRILLLTPRAELWSTCINLFHHHMLFLASFSSFACLSMQALPSGLVEAVVREMKWLCLLQHSLSPWVPGWWAVHHYAVWIWTPSQVLVLAWAAPKMMISILWVPELLPVMGKVASYCLQKHHKKVLFLVKHRHPSAGHHSRNSCPEKSTVQSSKQVQNDLFLRP